MMCSVLLLRIGIEQTLEHITWIETNTFQFTALEFYDEIEKAEMKAFVNSELIFDLKPKIETSPNFILVLILPTLLFLSQSST